jgi:hypothetical protein
MKAKLDEHGILLLTRHGHEEKYAICPVQTTVRGDISCGIYCPLFRVEYMKDLICGGGSQLNGRIKLHFCHGVSYEVDELEVE